jgi:hypothetical protein
MHAAKCGAHARALFDKSDSGVEISAAEKDVVQQCWRSLLRRPRDAWRGERGCEKGAAGNAARFQ